MLTDTHATATSTVTCAAKAAAEWWAGALRDERENLSATATGRLAMGCADAPTDKELSLFKEKLRSSISIDLEASGVAKLEATLYASRALREAARAAGFAPPWPRTVIMTVTADTVTIMTDMGEEIIWRQPS